MSDELRIEYIPLGEATLFEDNAKLHDIGSLVTSIRRYGFRDAVIYDEALGAIVAGNGRIEALAMMKQGGEEAPRGIKVEDGEWLVPVQFGVNALSVVEAKAFALDHNNITMLGGDFSPWDVAQMWDSDGYMALLGELAEADVLPVSVTGEDIDALLAGFGAEVEAGEDVPPQIDKGAELAEHYGVQVGQIWALGEHRLACGDCTDRAVVEALMGGEKAEYGFHDPPYGISLDLSWLSRLHEKANKPRNIATDESIPGDDGTLDTSIAFTAPEWLVWGFPYIAHPDMTGWLVWDKWPGVEDGGGLGNPVEMACTNLWKGFRIVRVMWGGYYRASGEKREPHPTQKPLGVIQPFIEQYTKAGDVITDYFVGSGTTIIACQNLGRRAYACEISPSYCGVAIQRWVDLTGEEPKLLP
jgi:hypothetical protein